MPPAEIANLIANVIIAAYIMRLAILGTDGLIHIPGLDRSTKKVKR